MSETVEFWAEVCDCTLRIKEPTGENQVRDSERNIARRTFRLIFSGK